MKKDLSFVLLFVITCIFLVSCTPTKKESPLQGGLLDEGVKYVGSIIQVRYQDDEVIQARVLLTQVVRLPPSRFGEDVVKNVFAVYYGWDADLSVVLLDGQWYDGPFSSLDPSNLEDKKVEVSFVK